VVLNDYIKYNTLLPQASPERAEREAHKYINTFWGIGGIRGIGGIGGFLNIQILQNGEMEKMEKVEKWKIKKC